MSRGKPKVREAREGPAPDGTTHLRIDPSICDGVGICSHLAPDLITLDSWGYPILDTHAVPRGRALRQAEAAVAACPKKALFLQHL
ncbi:MAG: ferredoxin [Actinomycetes bacterium]|jgi:ferredoxin